MTISAGRFKAECLKLMDVVNETHVSLTITKRGKPVARLVPVSEEKKTGYFGYLRGLVHVEDDIVSPIEKEWDVDGND